jgi:hypothetical protein
MKFFYTHLLILYITFSFELFERLKLKCSVGMSWGDMAEIDETV